MYITSLTSSKLEVGLVRSCSLNHNASENLYVQEYEVALSIQFYCANTFFTVGPAVTLESVILIDQIENSE